MIPEWVADYVGIPWVDKGRTREGLDCFGLMRIVLKEQFGVALPSYDDAYATADARDEVSALLADKLPESGWRPASPPWKVGDGVVFRVEGRPWHIGLLVGPGWVLHTMPGTDAHLERLDGARWARRVVGVYRHEAMA